MKIFKDMDKITVCYENGKCIVKNNDTPLLRFRSGKAHFINQDLIVVDDGVINIYQNIKQGLLSSSIISKQGIVVAKPILFNERIIVVFKDGIVQFDTNLNIIKSLSCDIIGVTSEEQLVGQYYIFNLTKDFLTEIIIYDIENNIVERERLNYDIMLLRS